MGERERERERERRNRQENKIVREVMNKREGEIGGLKGIVKNH